MDGAVGAWQPAADLGDRHVDALDAAAGGAVEGRLRVDSATAARIREVMGANETAWAGLFGARESATLLAWLRVLTLAEMQLPGCAAGAASPVVALARILRTRGEYPPSLTPWIRSVSTNRFLPYGSLKDRL